MNLYLMQHGACLPQEVNPNQPLSPVGQSQVASTAQAMRVMGLWFDALLTSPRHAAVQTTRIVAEGLGYAASSVTSFTGLDPGVSLKVCLEQLRVCERYQSVYLCGELPLLGDLASHLLTSGPKLSLALDGSALLAISVTSLGSRSGSLRWLLQGPQLQMIASS
ncbi:MAG: histidine phosphatase family protein [Desulfovibrio sp.]|nr:histidine phosphatase family protein [Desulfovibrio sp.]